MSRSRTKEEKKGGNGWRCRHKIKKRKQSLFSQIKEVVSLVSRGYSKDETRSMFVVYDYITGLFYIVFNLKLKIVINVFSLFFEMKVV